MEATTSWAPVRCRSSASGSCSSTRRSADSAQPRPTIIFATARLLDAFFSPVIGYISDHFHNTWLGKKFGRRRFFILLADPAGAELRAHVGGRPELLVLPDHLLLLRAGVRDGNHPVRNAGRGDVAQLPDQGEVRGRAHPLRADRQHRRDVAARRDHRAARRQGIGRHVPLPRRDLLGVLRVRGARRVPVHLGAAARGDREHRAARRPTVRRSTSSPICSRSSGRRCASARSACISACTSAAISARTS